MEKILSFAQTTVGASHLSRDIICQDSSLAADHEKYSFAAAADGHGSPCYLRTERGSKFAVECAAECVAEFLDGIENAAEVLADVRQREELFNQLWRSIIARWHDKTEQDFINEPFTEEEYSRIPEKFASYITRYESGEYIGAYGTTLLFAVVTEDYAFGAQIGDGKCVVIDGDSNVFAPIPEDPRCYENVTTSMCQDDAALSARFFYLPKGLMPAAVFLCTDGVENSYWNEEQLFSFFRGLALTIVENGMEDGVAQLADFLPAMTKKGSGDDVTCSGIINMPKLGACSDGIREDLEAAAAAISEETLPEDIEYADEESQQVISDVVAEPAESEESAEEAPEEQTEISE
ncbi:PP2C family serine/threonine-protein phosphatase [Ruminococcus flavefaciens]|uniref:PP2C family serine/threonine-protein phosphatase n=1 Tax=Ruminococcus flavefaciens TaxID=1265 RepID=UPI00048A8594|nr:PP2C family serine/threonine-protein phosphatase [Ruminococcus flavefaciens]